MAAAGILGNIFQESGGQPGARQSGGPGGGLIQITGDPGGSLASELAKTWAYIQQNGGIGPVNAAKSPAAAALVFSQKYERPGIPDNSNREASANASYKAGYAGGTSGATPGWHPVGEQGMEMVKMRGGEQVLPHALSMAAMGGKGYAGGIGSIGNVVLQFPAGAIQVNMGAGADVNAASKAASQVVQQIKKQLAAEDMLDAIAAGRTH
jgi:hypothetical protein